jgi:hypothetical protein
MTDNTIPSWVIPDEETYEWIDQGTVVFRSKFGPGISQRQSYADPTLRVTRTHRKVRKEHLGGLMSALRRAKGVTNVVRTHMHQVQRGSFPATELLTNPTFESTAGWTASAGTFSVADRMARIVADNPASGLGIYQLLTPTRYAPHVLRSDIRATLDSMRAGPFMNSGGLAVRGLRTVSGVYTDLGGSNVYAARITDTSGFVGGFDSVTVPYTSLSRCFEVDIGQNLLRRSDEFGTTWTTSNASISSNATAAPDGTTTADALVENTSNAGHYVLQPFTVPASYGDVCFCVAMKANTRSWGVLQVTDGTNTVYAHFNLSTGALGTAGTTNATLFAAVRSYVKPMGNGWYYCCLIFRNQSANTGMTAYILPATSDGGGTYLGTGVSSIYLWRGTASISGVPSRLVQTTSAVDNGTSPTGNQMFVKGLPESTAALLLCDDWFEINGELKQVTSPVSADAAGMSIMRFEPGLVRSPLQSDPIIVRAPMGKFLMSDLKIDNDFGQYSTVRYSLEHIYE